MGCRYGIDGRHGSSASFGSKLLDVLAGHAVFANKQFLPPVACSFFGIGIGIPYTGTGWSVFRSVFPGVLALLSLYSIVSCMFVVLYHTYIFLGGKGVPANFLYQKLLTKFSSGIGSVNTEKYRPNTDKNNESV